MAVEQDESVHFPLEMIKIIVPKLPVKSLFRFKSVSKSWNTMISDPTFVKNHLQISKHSNPHNLFMQKNPHSKGFFPLVKFEDRKFRTVKLLECPCAWDKFLAFCDGLLLLSDISYKKLTLWNPSTRQTTKFEFPYARSCYPMSYGLFHDRTVGDFKVVVICRDHYKVYSCNDKAWTRKRRIQGIGLVQIGYGVCVDGVVYWVNRWSSDGTHILYFDTKDDDELKVLRKPENVNLTGKMIDLICLRDSLCMCCIGRGVTNVQIWIKGKGSRNSTWKELMTIENVQTRASCFEPLLHFVGNKILIVWKDSKLVVYNPSEKTFEEVDDSVLSGRGFFPYTESLFFPNQNN
ncbi:hypothetical protein MIMGU_mgv1a024875mg [Erythranthe guttata]|uniref:F-box domain-containing protein n=1 Tax=Erythranthe guttata TaxID=4155 RepID=A0A022RJJ1_ERYGU|nr:PREDICTED: F-box/kelch-repeat protein At3g23880-like [Erythranthe guttata]EYU40597.1 hypothetical protein MIMGU_mgv1a024875mg [Erythranthe guttata]|eukprot:XP_012833502.1 PREDICTED: F-box/kelch-repeat protein At3g23880-like [Erythranthe guttata]